MLLDELDLAEGSPIGRAEEHEHNRTLYGIQQEHQAGNASKVNFEMIPVIPSDRIQRSVAQPGSARARRVFPLLFRGKSPANRLAVRARLIPVHRLSGPFFALSATLPSLHP